MGRFDSDSESESHFDEEEHMHVVLGDMAAEIETLFDGSFTVDRLYEAGVGGLRKGNLRIVYWKVFLGLLSVPENGSTVEDVLERWEVESERSREKYAALKAQHAINIKSRHLEDDDEEGLAVDNPLSDHQESSWGDYFKHSQIEREIQKDLTRMSDEVAFYEKRHIHDLMLNALRMYTLEYPDPGYRQGMHDLLGTFVYFFYRNNHSLRASTAADKKKLKPATLDLLTLVLPTSEEDLEGEVFQLFEALLQGKRSRLVDWYIVVRSGVRNEETPIMRMCKRLQSTVLPMYDNELYKHLKEHDIEPTVYALRWFRVWFIREFGVRGAAPLWDAVLCEILYHTVSDTDIGVLEASGLNPLEMGVMPLISAAMLLYLSADLRSYDYSQTLKRLMRYPPVEDVHAFVTKSLSWSETPLQKYLPKELPPPPPPSPPQPAVQPQTAAVPEAPAAPAANSKSSSTLRLPTLGKKAPSVQTTAGKGVAAAASAAAASSSMCTNHGCREHVRAMVRGEHHAADRLQVIIDSFQYALTVLYCDECAHPHAHPQREVVCALRPD